jgi:replication fork protection complex subunit Tof1/Swi1
MAGVRFSSPPLGQYDPDDGLGYDEDDIHGGDVSDGGDGDMDVDDDAGSMIGLSDYDSVQSRYEVFLPAVQSLVNAIGGYETVDDIRPDGSTGIKSVYRPGDSVLAVLKDLKRLWRKDDTDDERTVARCMAQAGLMRELTNLLVECFDRGEWGRKVSLVACESVSAGEIPRRALEDENRRGKCL